MSWTDKTCEGRKENWVGVLPNEFSNDVAHAFVGELAGPCNEVLCPG